MKKLLVSVLTFCMLSVSAFAMDHSQHSNSASGKVSSSGEHKKMACMTGKNEGNMIPLSKSIAEDIVEEQILNRLKNFSIVKSEKNDHGFDIYVKDNNGNNFKITLKGHIISSGLEPVKQ
ncbi:MAG: hypothetical protein N3C60_05835 [Calditerrivibrio sp.]|nr:hypothetical protein [Calditerrivibrio sp.]